MNDKENASFELMLVVRFVKKVLEPMAQPMRRDALVLQVRRYAYEQFGANWHVATAARNLRFALAVLLDGDSPVISAGHGFMLASKATPEQRSRAVNLARKMATSLHRKADKIERAAVPSDPVQERLFT